MNTPKMKPIIKSSDEKVAIVQTAIERHFITNPEIDPNRRMGALFLAYDLTNTAWEQVFSDTDYFVGIIICALRTAYDKDPNPKYQNMIQEIYDYWEKEDAEAEVEK